MTNPKRKVFILLDSLRFGGAEKQIISLVNNINSEIYDVSLGYLKKKEALLSQINKNKLRKLICFNRSRRFDLSVFRKFRKLCVGEKYDVVLCVGLYPMFYVYLSKLFWKIEYKLITAIHFTIQNPGIWIMVKNIFFRKILNRCDVILFVCRNQMDYWIQNYGINETKSKYIYNGIDLEYFTDTFSLKEKEEKRSVLNIDNGDILIGNVAALRPEKKQEDIITAAKIIRSDGYPVKVLIVGDGPRMKNILEYARSIAMDEHVQITGFQEDIRPYLSIIDCKILSSDAVETFSIAALEAMAMSKPVIMTDIGGASEMVCDWENGFLFRPRNIDDLVSKIRIIIQKDLFEEMGKRSRKIVEEKYTLKKMVNEYEICFY